MRDYCRALAIAAMTVGMSAAAIAKGRDYISIVGSSTVYPFATVVAERFGRSTAFRAPMMESTGSGGGLKLFCKGVGVHTPDITNSSRRIKPSEFEDCQRNGVRQILEIMMGYDGIVIANAKSSPRMVLTLKDLYLALAKHVPGEGGKLVLNPHRTWQDVNPSLPDVRIEMLGPPPTSGTRDAFAELVLRGGALQVPTLRALHEIPADNEAHIKQLLEQLGPGASLYDAAELARGRPPSGKEIFISLAQAVREDGAYVEAGENDNLVVQKLGANPRALGIFGYSFLEENVDLVHGASVDGVTPSYATISSGEYVISRPLYFYVKIPHVGRIPGIIEYVREFLSDRAMGEAGYLADRGLVPPGPDDLMEMRLATENLSPLKL